MGTKKSGQQDRENVMHQHEVEQKRTKRYKNEQSVTIINNVAQTREKIFGIFWWCGNKFDLYG